VLELPGRHATMLRARRAKGQSNLVIVIITCDATARGHRRDAGAPARAGYNRRVTSPMRPLPMEVERWMARLGPLRWADAIVAWLVGWAIVVAATEARPGPMALIAAIVVAGAAWTLPGLRVRWRPVSAAVGLRMSRPLRPGARAWYIRADAADLVIVTARRGLRIVIAGIAESRTEGFAVRRTRVLLIPAD